MFVLDEKGFCGYFGHGTRMEEYVKIYWKNIMVFMKVSCII